MNNLPEKIEDLVRSATLENLSGSKEGNYPFLNAEDYKTKTGHRFRMTREQKNSGLTREQAFEQFMQKMVDKV